MSLKKNKPTTEAKLAMLGTPQAVGYGKNYHTEKPDPITWENLDGLDHFITATPEGTFLAGLNLPGTDMSTPVYKFQNEEEAMMWLRNVKEKYRISKANQER